MKDILLGAESVVKERQNHTAVRRFDFARFERTDGGVKGGDPRTAGSLVNKTCVELGAYRCSTVSRSDVEMEPAACYEDHNKIAARAPHS